MEGVSSGLGGLGLWGAEKRKIGDLRFWSPILFQVLPENHSLIPLHALDERRWFVFGS